MTKNFMDAEKIRQAVTKTARMLARDRVEIRQRGGQPHVKYRPDGTVEYVNLPMIPDNPSPEFLHAVQGFLDHEIAHVLFTSNLPLVALAERAKREGMSKKLLHSFANIFEDIRIERDMGNKYRGSRFNLGKSLEFVIERIIGPGVEKALEIPIPDLRERQAISSAFVPWARATAGDEAAKEFMDKNDLWQFFRKLEAKMPSFASDLKSMKDTADAGELAYRFCKMLDIPPPSGGGGEGDGEGEGGGKSDKKDKPKKTDKKEKGEADEGEDGSGSESEGDEEGGAGDGEETDDELDGDAAGELAKALEEIEDMDGMLASVITEMMPREFSTVKFLEYTRDFDQVVTVDPHVDADVARMESDVARVSATMQKDLQRLIVARTQAIQVPGFRRGRLNPGALHRLETGEDRIFRRKQVNTTKKVAVQLVVDCSGSMSGAGKIGTALRSAWAFSSVLDRLNIVNEVIGFTTVKGDRRAQVPAQEFAAQTRHPANAVRWEPLYMPVFKEFDERFTLEVKRRLATADMRSWQGAKLSENIDGASILQAAKRILVRKEPRKLMIVFSDGAPCSRMDRGVLGTHLKYAVKEIEKMGVETIGVGIQDLSVHHYYPKNFTVKQLDELPGKIMGELRGFLTR